MNEEEARAWVRAQFGVSRETLLDRFSCMLTEEAARQNLVSASTLDSLWARHLVDSAQLIPLAGPASGDWLDIGSGAGLPGMVVAILTDRETHLVEPRSRRVAFLEQVAETLSLTNVRVHASRVETVQFDRPAGIVSARAVAALPDLLAAAYSCTDSSTIWLLPKGRNAQSEVEAARRKWQGTFHVEQSITAPDSGIVIARGVRPK